MVFFVNSKDCDNKKNNNINDTEYKKCIDEYNYHKNNLIYIAISGSILSLIFIIYTLSYPKKI